MKLLQNAASRKAALEGTMLCIDPTSGGTSKRGEKSEAGYAIFKEGILVESGTLEFPEDTVVFKRLRNVREVCEKEFVDSYDLLVLEDIRGFKAQQSLIQSCGVYITSLKSSQFFQPNVQTWKAVARMWGGYKKSDEADAIYMGYATIAIALGWNSKLSVGVKEEIIIKAQETVQLPVRKKSPKFKKNKKRKK